jgi:hypothetical protein
MTRGEYRKREDSMTYSIELFFDPVSLARLSRLWSELQAIYGPPVRSELGVEPHLALAVFRAGEPEGAAAVLEQFARCIRPFEVELSAVETFATAEGVVYLRAEPHPELIQAHATLHELLAGSTGDCLPYYFPGAWIPHVTLATNVPPCRMSEVVAACREADVLGRVGIERVGGVCYRPARYRQQYALTG